MWTVVIIIINKYIMWSMIFQSRTGLRSGVAAEARCTVVHLATNEYYFSLVHALLFEEAIAK